MIERIENTGHARAQTKISLPLRRLPPVPVTLLRRAAGTAWRLCDGDQPVKTIQGGGLITALARFQIQVVQKAGLTGRAIIQAGKAIRGRRAAGVAVIGPPARTVLRGDEPVTGL